MRPPRPSRAEIQEARFQRFLRDLKVYEQQVELEETTDEFLELYQAWIKRREPSMKVAIVSLLFRIHTLNPKFTFDLFFNG